MHKFNYSFLDNGLNSICSNQHNGRYLFSQNYVFE